MCSEAVVEVAGVGAAAVHVEEVAGHVAAADAEARRAATLTPRTCNG